MMTGVMIGGGAASVIMLFALGILMSPSPGPGSGSGGGSAAAQALTLPEPVRDGKTSLEKAISERRSVRAFSDASLSSSEVSQLLWAASGVTDADRGYRAAPSAGATYPLNVYLVAGAVEDLPAGIHRYSPRDHSLTSVVDGDVRSRLRAAALGQESVGAAPAAIILTGVYSRTTARYSERGVMYTHIEAGHVAQNAQLQAVALGLGMVPIGAFEDDAVGRLLSLPEGEVPLYILPMGRPDSG